LATPRRATWRRRSASRRWPNFHFGVLIPRDDDDERARRSQRLGAIDSTFDPLPLAAAIAAMADVHNVPLLTENTAGFRIIRDLVDARAPVAPDVPGSAR
jgi:hypothetical protein